MVKLMQLSTHLPHGLVFIIPTFVLFFHCGKLLFRVQVRLDDDGC